MIADGKSWIEDFIAHENSESWPKDGNVNRQWMKVLESDFSCIRFHHRWHIAHRSTFGSFGKCTLLSHITFYARLSWLYRYLLLSLSRSAHRHTSSLLPLFTFSRISRAIKRVHTQRQHLCMSVCLCVCVGSHCRRIFLFERAFFRRFSPASIFFTLAVAAAAAATVALAAPVVSVSTLFSIFDKISARNTHYVYTKAHLIAETVLPFSAAAVQRKSSWILSAKIQGQRLQRAPKTWQMRDDGDRYEQQQQQQQWRWQWLQRR